MPQNGATDRAVGGTIVGKFAKPLTTKGTKVHEGNAASKSLRDTLCPWWFGFWVVCPESEPLLAFLSLDAPFRANLFLVFLSAEGF